MCLQITIRLVFCISYCILGNFNQAIRKFTVQRWTINTFCQTTTSCYQISKFHLTFFKITAYLHHKFWCVRTWTSFRLAAVDHLDPCLHLAATGPHLWVQDSALFISKVLKYSFSCALLSEFCYLCAALEFKFWPAMKFRSFINFAQFLLHTYKYRNTWWKHCVRTFVPLGKPNGLPPPLPQSEKSLNEKIH